MYIGTPKQKHQMNNKLYNTCITYKNKNGIAINTPHVDKVYYYYLLYIFYFYLFSRTNCSTPPPKKKTKKTKKQKTNFKRFSISDSESVNCFVTFSSGVVLVSWCYIVNHHHQKIRHFASLFGLWEAGWVRKCWSCCSEDPLARCHIDPHSNPKKKKIESCFCAPKYNPLPFSWINLTLLPFLIVLVTLLNRITFLQYSDLHHFVCWPLDVCARAFVYVCMCVCPQ